MTNTLINGEQTETLNIADRGLQYGDGLFETMAAKDGKVALWETHWQRLSLGCEKLCINLPNKDTVEAEIDLLLNKVNEELSVIKLIITRGIGKRGYSFTEQQNPTRILSCHPWPEQYEEFQNKGVTVKYCETILSENKQLAGIKHLNRLEQVLARNEWDNDEFQEGLMLTAQGNVVDGIMSNIFAVLEGKLFTPDLSLCGVSGVMRQTIIKIAKELNYAIYEKDFTKIELEMADELFLSNSLFGIWPINLIGKTRYTKVGKVTKQLQQAINKLG